MSELKKYAILEDNMERLEKKLAAISKKCSRYGCTFHYQKVGEEFRESKVDGKTVTLRYIIVEAEGTAKLNDWRFVATLDPTPSGNIIRSCCHYLEVPERYYTADAVCEHCNTKRRRKQTFIVYNDKTGEFKQVGKSCLADFTNGLSAERVAQYISFFDELIEGDAIQESTKVKPYFLTREVLKYMFETIHHFGYVKKPDFFEGYDADPNLATANRGSKYYLAAEEGGYSLSTDTCKSMLNEMDKYHFNAHRSEIVDEVDAALAWLSKQADSNNYMHNLKIICGAEYIDSKGFGIAASLLPAYQRDLQIKHDRKQRSEAARSEAEHSQYQGELGERITVKSVELKCVCANDSLYGVSFLYKMVDAEHNVYMWSTGNYFDAGSYKLVGTVKDHKEFRGVKQTIVTRCKLTSLAEEPKQVILEDIHNDWEDMIDV